MPHLTDLAVRKVESAASRREIPDDDPRGLFLVIQPSGKMSWAYRYRFDGVSRKLTIGPVDAIPLKRARKLAQKAAGAVAEGLDPHAAKQEARRAQALAARAERDLVENVAADFLARHVNKLRERTAGEVTRIINKEVIPPWRGRRIHDIRKRDVLEIVNAIADRGKGVMANRVLATIRRLFSWAIDQDIVAALSPAAGVKPPAAEISRDRVLGVAELAAIWHAAGEAGRFGTLVKLLVLTGARRNEVAFMTWREIDLDSRTWTVPASRSKNGRANTLPLNDCARAVLAGLPRAGELVMNGLTDFAKGKQRLDRAVLDRLRRDNPDAEPLDHWTLHDIRRSVASGLARMGQPIHVVEAILNHRSGTISGVARIYNRYSYEPEKRAALDAWAAHVEAITTGTTPASNVLEFPARA